MKRNYQGVVKRIKQVAEAHPQINSADDGRELEFDVGKKQLWPRVFIRTDSSDIIGGDGTVELTVNFTLLIADRLKANRDNIVDVLNTTHGAMTDILATLHKEQLIRLDNKTATPLYDYQDSQSAGWSIPITVWLDDGFKCYTA